MFDMLRNARVVTAALSVGIVAIIIGAGGKFEK